MIFWAKNEPTKDHLRDYFAARALQGLINADILYEKT